MKNLFYLVLVLALVACQKYEGTGGRASVKGKIYVKKYNQSFTQLLDEYYAPEERVYIMYGDNEVYDDDMRTNFDGAFEFNFLKKGNYTIFVYSEDTTFTVPGGLEPIFYEFEITDKKETIDLGDITIIN
ncbi:MAG: hypothetical protein ACI837_003494 [Crocinitomicaceae bacterium]|jgi:hypothetical protein